MVLALAGLVCGCAGLPPARQQAGVLLGSDGMGYQAAALRAAAEAFLGPPPPGGGGGGGASIPGNVFNPGSGTEYHRTRSRRAGLWAERIQPLGHGFGVIARAEAGAGQSSYLLPKGVGVLGDPLRVDFFDTAAALRLGLGAGMAVGSAGRLQVAAGAGVRVVHSRTTLDSALIHLINGHTRKIGFTYAEATLAVAPRRGPALRLSADAERDADGAFAYGLRLEVPF